MPHFTSSVSDLETVGPIVDLTILQGSSVVDAMKKEGKEIPPSMSIAAMIDTGASATVIKQGIAQQLGLHPVSQVEISTPSSTVICYKYLVTLVFPTFEGAPLGRITYEGVIIEAPMPGGNIDCLIGRDILKHVIFVYTGPDDSFSFSF